MLSLNEKEWKEFPINEIFNEVGRGKRLKKDDHIKGYKPYVSSTALNNGVDQFIGNEKGIRVFENCLSLANSGSVGSCFYEPFPFVASDHVTHLKKDDTSKYVYLFMATMLNRLSEKYNFNREINDFRINREKILLPVTEMGEPDFDYMEQYAKVIECKKRSQYIAFCNQKIADLGEIITIKASSEIEWKPFSITRIFQSIVPGKGKGLNHLMESSGGVSYIGATNRNNGVMCYVSIDEKSKTMLQEGNCIGFIKNGDGAAGYAIYKSEPFISTSDVLYGYADWLNQYTGLFFVSAQDMIEAKYSHGYKRNRQHLSGDKVMLPIAEDGEPDYDYMEQYAKNMMIRKYQAYLDYYEKAGK